MLTDWKERRVLEKDTPIYNEIPGSRFLTATGGYVKERTLIGLARPEEMLLCGHGPKMACKILGFKHDPDQFLLEEEL